MSEMTFSDLPLSDDMLSALDEMGYITPTPVQATAVPMVATGCDLMVQSQTGTGKTAAFAIPLIEKLGDKPQGIQALILCPTRELAKQVAEETTRLCRFKKIQAVAVYGGASIEKQIAEIRFSHIVVGTPGRTLDHLKRGTLKLDNMQMLILDEADEMLSMGFARELDQIMGFVPKQRQTLLFSATIPEDIKRYGRRYMREPEFLSMVEENVAADDVEHIYYMVSGVARRRDLVRVIKANEPESAIIFTNTRRDTESVARYLRENGYDAEFLNGDLAQRERERVMGLTKDKSLRFLVATDIAARGIDITQLSHVINYTLPESPEVYIHRTGRTGRAGAKGTAISLIGPREIGVYYYLKRIYSVALEERELPSKAEIELRRHEKEIEELVQRITDLAGKMEDDAPLRRHALRLLEREDSVQIVHALLKHFRDGARPAKKTTVGGVLKDVPKPGRRAPGSRAQSVQSVADRVAIVTGEFRGRPKDEEKGPRRSRRPRHSEPEVETQPQEQQETQQPQDPPSRPRRTRRRRPESVLEGRDGGLPAETAKAVRNDEATEVEPPRAQQAPKEESDSRRRNSRSREDRKRKPPRSIPEGYNRLFVNIGRRDQADEAQVRDELSELAGLLPEDIATIDLHGRHCYIDVLEEYSEDLIEAVNGETLANGKTVRVEIARSNAS